MKMRYLRVTSIAFGSIPKSSSSYALRLPNSYNFIRRVIFCWNILPLPTFGCSEVVYNGVHYYSAVSCTVPQKFAAICAKFSAKHKQIAIISLFKLLVKISYVNEYLENDGDSTNKIIECHSEQSLWIAILKPVLSFILYCSGALLQLSHIPIQKFIYFSRNSLIFGFQLFILVFTMALNPYVWTFWTQFKCNR